MDKDQEGIIEKVRKLLALAGNNSSQAEAESAMLAAQKLMAAHGLETTDVERVAAVKDDVITSTGKLRTRFPWWHMSLAGVLAPNFKCKHLVHRERDEKRKLIGSCIAFVGHPADVDVCKTVYQYAIERTDMLVRMYVKRFKILHPDISGAAIKNTWLLGFVDGLRDKFQEQVEKNNWGLILITDEAVTQKYDALVTGKVHGSTIRATKSQKVRQDGYTEGKKFEPVMGKIEA